MRNIFKYTGAKIDEKKFKVILTFEKRIYCLCEVLQRDILPTEQVVTPFISDTTNKDPNEPPEFDSDYDEILVEPSEPPESDSDFEEIFTEPNEPPQDELDIQLYIVH